MKSFDLRSVVAVAALAMLTACGGSAPEQGGAAVSTAAVMGYAAGPVADCDAEGGCNGPRIIDGMAEQYRAGAIALQQAEEQQALQPAAAAPAPTQNGDSASEAPAAAGAPAQ